MPINNPSRDQKLAKAELKPSQQEKTVDLEFGERKPASSYGESWF